MRSGKRTRQPKERTPRPKRAAVQEETEAVVSTAFVRGALGPESCDRCGQHFSKGYRWASLGVPLLLCSDCTEDIEESVASYGEKGEVANRRFLARLRNLGAETTISR